MKFLWVLGFYLFMINPVFSQTTTMTIPVVSANDDAEELSSKENNSKLNPGDVDLANPDNELVDDNSWNGPGQTVGIRFTNIELPKGVSISDAYIEFKAKASNSEPASLTIKVEDVANARGFANTPNNISGRATSSTVVAWNNVEAWTSGNIYRTPNLAALVNTAMSKENWKEGNAIAFIFTGSGVRNAYSFDGNNPAKLVLKYDLSSVVFKPIIVQEIPDAELAAGWDFYLDLKPFFKDKDSELSFEAYETELGTLPGWLTLDNGILYGTKTTAGTTNITVKATGEGDFVTNEFVIDYCAISGDFTLAIFHNNDSESHLLPEKVTLDGQVVSAASVSQFKAVVDSLKNQAESRGYESLMLSSGDNFLAGMEYNAAQKNRIYYDVVALDSINYDAIDLGNHDFDFGTQKLSEFIQTLNKNKAPFLTSNLSFENVPELNSLSGAGRIKPYTIINKAGQEIGVIGLTTPLLPAISSPGKTLVSGALADSVQKYVDELENMGVNKIILTSHLQALENDLELVKNISGVDIIIAGGGHEFLSNSTLLGKPFNVEPYDTYPMVAKDKINNNVYIATTAGSYRFVGNLVVNFDANGAISKVFKTDPVLVAGKSNVTLKANIEEPIKTYINNLGKNVIATAQDSLDFRRETLRHKESNGGNLFADAILYQARKEYANFGVKKPVAAILNAGALRVECVVGEGNFTEDLTYKIAAFKNIVSVVENITPAKFLELIEHGVAQAPKLNGRFPQLAGFKVVFDPLKDAGKRVVSITLNDNTTIVENGEIVAGAPSITMATIDFIANGGDGYPFLPYKPVTIGATYQQAFYNYLVDANGLNGDIPSTQYPLGMNERIVEKIHDQPAK